MSIKLIHIKNSQTRTDCERDNVAVKLPNSSSLGFSIAEAKSGYWIMYEKDDRHFIGRVICRVTCDLQIWLEIAQLSECGTHCYIRWIDPMWVKECREKPPRRPFDWITSEKWEPQQVHDDLNYGGAQLALEGFSTIP